MTQNEQMASLFDFYHNWPMDEKERNIVLLLAGKLLEEPVWSLKEWLHDDKRVNGIISFYLETPRSRRLLQFPKECSLEHVLKEVGLYEEIMSCNLITIDENLIEISAENFLKPLQELITEGWFAPAIRFYRAEMEDWKYEDTILFKIGYHGDSAYAPFIIGTYEDRELVFAPKNCSIENLFTDYAKHLKLYNQPGDIIVDGYGEITSKEQIDHPISSYFEISQERPNKIYVDNRTTFDKFEVKVDVDPYDDDDYCYDEEEW